MAMQICKGLLLSGAAALLLSSGFASAADTPHEAELRAALRKMMAELGNDAHVPPSPTQAPAAAAPATMMAQPVVNSSMVAPAGQEDAQTARLRQALYDRMAQENAAAQITAPAPVAAGQPAEAKPVPAVPAPVPMVAPPLPISGTKEQRLAELLRQYKADTITPQQYHEQRAKIIAE
jgi:hypothetical protein